VVVRYLSTSSQRLLSSSVRLPHTLKSSQERGTKRYLEESSGGESKAAKSPSSDAHTSHPAAATDALAVAVSIGVASRVVAGERVAEAPGDAVDAASTDAELGGVGDAASCPLHPGSPVNRWHAPGAAGPTFTRSHTHWAAAASEAARAADAAVALLALLLVAAERQRRTATSIVYCTCGAPMLKALSHSGCMRRQCALWLLEELNRAQSRLARVGEPVPEPAK
jgi:hypothetical protein